MSYSTLPVFWIGGRSGSGKSVALLHLLAGLQDRHQGTVLWLANNIESLPSTLRWARELVRPGKRVLIGLDDPFTPGQQTDALNLWREAVAAVLDARESGRSEEVPLLFCCGPTEQGHLLQQELRQNVNLDIHDLPKERQEEFQELRSWYRERKGIEPPAVGNRNTLLGRGLAGLWDSSTGAS